MRAPIFMLVCALAASPACAVENERTLAFSLGAFSGSDTSGVALGLYSLRPGRIGWYVNGTLSSSVDADEDEDFRPIPGDIRVDGETESATVNVGLTFALGRFAPYVGVGLSTISEYGLYRTPSAAFWYEEEDDTQGNVNVGVLCTLYRRLGLDLGANSANEEITLGLKWEFR